MAKVRFEEHFDENLMPCPFCGAEAARDWHDVLGVFIKARIVPHSWEKYSPDGGTMYTVQCGRCYARIGRATLEAAKAAWDTRGQVTG